MLLDKKVGFRLNYWYFALFLLVFDLLIEERFKNKQKVAVEVEDPGEIIWLNC